MNREKFLKEILFRRQAEELAGMSRHAFQYHLNKGNIHYCKEDGAGRGKTQLFWKEDVENLKKGKYKEENKVKNLLDNLKKEYLGKEIDLLNLDGIGEYSLDHIFVDNVYNLELGTYNKQMKGSYSFQAEECEDDHINIEFETVGNWDVIDNTQNSNLYLTRIDENNLKIKVTDIYVV